MILQVLREGSLLIDIEINDKTVYSKILMGDNTLRVEYTTTTPLPVKIGDYIVYKSRTYWVNKISDLTANDVSFTYIMIFEPLVYRLYDKKFKQLGAKTFTFFGTLQAHLQLLIDNINTIDSGWTLGTVADLPEKYISYDKDDCRTALTKIANEFGIEYDVDERIITAIKSIGTVTSLEFEVGYQKGLYQLTRQSVDDSKVVTRAYGYGGTRNIDYRYRNNTKELIFEGEYLEKNVDLYPTVKEGDYENPDIFPQRTAAITSVTALANGVFTIADTTIDFDINTYLQEGIPAKVVFKSGELSGSEFEMQSYNHSTKTLTLKQFKDSNDYTLPNTTFSAAVGDTYTLVDINMPQSYIDASELQLRNETQEWLDENSIPRVLYQLDIDEKYVRDNSISIKAGDYIIIKDARLGIDGLLRISQIEWPVTNEANIKCTISNFILDSTANRIIKAVKNSQTEIRDNQYINTLNARDNFRVTQELTTLLNSLQAELLLIAVDGSIFDTDVFATVERDNFSTSDGSLINQQYEGAWNVAASNHPLTSNVPFYVYVRASRTDSSATVIISQAKIDVEAESGYYHFLYGIISSINSDTRVFTSTKGYTRIVGENIQTGRITSVNGRTYFDLDNGVLELAQNAGLSGNGLLGSDIRFWAGKNYADRATAPFRVDHDGNLVATNANITGHIEATSGSIAGVSISANDQFSLNGSKVQIYPDKGVAVQGFLTIPKAPVSDPLAVGYQIYIDELGTGGGATPPPIVVNLTDLQDVAISSPTNGQALVYNSVTGKWVNGAGGGTPIDAYTKSESDARFKAIGWFPTWTEVTGKPTNFVFNDGGTYGINISGNSATVTNGVYSNGNYSNPSWITSLAWTKIDGRPTSLSQFTNDLGNYGGFALADASNINVNNYKSALGLPTSGAYDLQWVTDNGAETTHLIAVGSGSMVKGTNPYIQWQNASGTRLGYIQHATNLVVSADTGKIVLSNSTDVVGVLTVDLGYAVSNYGIGLIGVYNEARYQAVFSMGTAYGLSADGTSLANHYGIAWTYQGMGQAKAGLGHQMLITEAGITQTAIGNGIWTRANIYAAGTIEAPSIRATSKLETRGVTSGGTPSGTYYDLYVQE